MKFTVLIVAIIFTVAASDIEAQELGDPVAGLNFAKKVCAECH